MATQSNDQYKTDKDWRDALAASGNDPELQKAYGRWQDLGGENQITLQKDFDQNYYKAHAPNITVPNGQSQAQVIRDYITSIAPKNTANYGNDDKASYESEKARLAKAASSSSLTPDEKHKIQLQAQDLDNHFRDKAAGWYSEDLAHAGSDKEAQDIQRKIDGLKNSTTTNDGQKEIDDIIAGGTGYGDQGDSSWQVGAGGMGGGYLDNISKDWNNQTLGATYDQVGKQIGDNAKLTSQQQLGYYDQGSNRALAGLTGADAKATTDTQAAIDALTKSGQYTKDQITALIGKLSDKQATTDASSSDAIKQLQGDYGKFGTERNAATTDYTNSLDPLKKQLTADDYTGVATSADDIKRLTDSYGNLENNAAHGADQLQDVYGKYNDLSKSGFTDQERAMLEAGNRSATRSQKSFLDATTRGLRDRGMLTGDAVLGAAGQNAQTAGDTHLDTILGALASVQKRKQDALAGMGSTAGTIASQKNTSGANLMTGANAIRSGNDAMTEFNKGQEGITQRFKTSFQQSEMDRLAGLAKQREDTILNKTSGDLTAATGMNNSVQDQLDKAFGRETQVTNTGLTGTQNQYAIDQGISGDKITAANNEAGRAANETNANLTNTNNRTNLIGTTSDRDEEALKYQLGLLAEKKNLKNLGSDTV